MLRPTHTSVLTYQIEGSSHEMVLNARAILRSASAYQYHGMLLDVVTLWRDQYSLLGGRYLKKWYGNAHLLLECTR